MYSPVCILVSEYGLAFTISEHRHFYWQQCTRVHVLLFFSFLFRSKGQILSTSWPLVEEAGGSMLKILKIEYASVDFYFFVL